MGYQTTYNLSYHFLGHQDRFEETMLEHIRENPNEEWDWELSECWEDLTAYGHTSKWYSHDSEMRALSKRFPMVVFTLEGKGEEGGDLWKKYYCAGKCQEAYAKIVYDEFDPEKLK